jgi:hypothetical protein
MDKNTRALIALFVVLPFSLCLFWFGLNDLPELFRLVLGGQQ